MQKQKRKVLFLFFKYVHGIFKLKSVCLKFLERETLSIVELILAQGKCLCTAWNQQVIFATIVQATTAVYLLCTHSIQWNIHIIRKLSYLTADYTTHLSLFVVSIVQSFAANIVSIVIISGIPQGDWNSILKLNMKRTSPKS